MKTEREVVRVIERSPGVAGYSFDYPKLEVGDWFIVRSRNMRAAILRAKPRGAAKKMGFVWHEIGFHEWRVERVS